MSLRDHDHTFQEVYGAQQLSARAGAGHLEGIEAKVFWNPLECSSTLAGL